MEKVKFPIFHKTMINSPTSDVFKLFSTSEGWDSWFTHGTNFKSGETDCYFNWRGWGADKVDVRHKIDQLEIIENKSVTFRWNFGLSAGPTTVVLELNDKDGKSELLVKEIGYENSDEGHEALIECSTGWGEALTLIKIYAEHKIAYN